MATIAEEMMLIRVRLWKEKLQEIESGRCMYAQDMEARSLYASLSLCHVLEDVVGVVPEPLQSEVRACLALQQRVWSFEYVDAYYEAEKKAGQGRSDQDLFANSPSSYTG